MRLPCAAVAGARFSPGGSLKLQVNTETGQIITIRCRLNSAERIALLGAELRDGRITSLSPEGQNDLS